MLITEDSVPVGPPTNASPAEIAAATPRPVRPKFPNAKTYKDKQGNIREVGTGRLIRAVAKKVTPGGKTVTKKGKGNSYFVDGQGVTRRIGTGVAKNPLDAQVDAAILQQTAPLTTQIGQTNQQFTADQGVLTGSNTALQTQLGQLQQRIGDISAGQLGNAANAAGGTAANQTANLDYLKSILGSNMLDGGASLAGGGAALAAQAQSEGASDVKGIQLGALGQTADLAGIGAANALQTSSTIADRMRARNVGLTDLQSKIAAAKANRTAVKNDLVNTSLDQAAARQQIRLADAQYADNKAQQGIENQLNQDQLALQTQAQKDEAAADAAKANEPKPSTIGKYTLASLDKKYDTAADAVYKMVEKTPPNERRYRNIVSALRNRGIPGGSAVILAAQWAPNRASDPATTYATLKNGTLGFKVSDAVAKIVFQAAGLDWEARKGDPANATVPATSSKPVTSAMLQSTIRGSKPKVGSTIRQGDRSFTVKTIQRTISGLLYTLDPGAGQPIVKVTVPNRGH